MVMSANIELSKLLTPFGFVTIHTQCSFSPQPWPAHAAPSAQHSSSASDSESVRLSGNVTVALRSSTRKPTTSASIRVSADPVSNPASDPVPNPAPEPEPAPSDQSVPVAITSLAAASVAPIVSADVQLSNSGTDTVAHTASTPAGGNDVWNGCTAPAVRARVHATPSSSPRVSVKKLHLI
eukprot:6197296-Pleurochrysis_carterae.AAC.2